MLNRIKKNEQRLDKIKECTSQLEISLENFKSNLNDLIELKKYYGSKEWFSDKEKYENNSISKIKAGVLL